MSDNSAIEWTDATWNPVTGCTKISAGCDHCYAERLTERFHGKGSFAKIVLHPERLAQPSSWKRPRRVFVNSMSDLFHPEVPDEFIVRTFGVMASTERHQFQILTKRPRRALQLLAEEFRKPSIAASLAQQRAITWPLPNVWLGVSVEDQRWADQRIPLLLETPAAVRFLSCEPLLGPLCLDHWQGTNSLDWVIVGGESGPQARPMAVEWARSIRDQCVEANVAFFFKQWGGHTPKAGGRTLDGETWDQWPSPKTHENTVDQASARVLV